MSQPFDPYEKWFEISPEDRPINHYLLLGIKPYEPNLKVIRAAGEKRVEFLQDVSGGRHVETAQKCLNEVAKAVLCLTNPTKKLAYDRQLKNASQVSAAPELGSPVLVNTAENSTGRTSDSNRARTVSRPRTGSSSRQTKTAGSKRGVGNKAGLLFKIAASAVLVITIGYLLSVLLSGGKKKKATAQAKKTVAEKKYDEDWKYPGSKQEPAGETSKPKKINIPTSGEPAEKTPETKKVTVPTSKPDEPVQLGPERVADLSVFKGQTVQLERVVAAVTTSPSKKTIYLRFLGEGGLNVFMRRSKVGEDWNLESVKQQFEEKRVQVTGRVRIITGKKRIGIEVTKKEQIKLVEQQ